MKKLMLTLLCVVSANAFADDPGYISASKIAQNLVSKCQTQANQLGEIMSNADAGARYKFDSNTIEGRRGMAAHDFALNNKDELARQDYLTTALSTCIRDSSANLKRAMNQ